MYLRCLGGAMLLLEMAIRPHRQRETVDIPRRTRCRQVEAGNQETPEYDVPLPGALWLPPFLSHDRSPNAFALHGSPGMPGSTTKSLHLRQLCFKSALAGVIFSCKFRLPAQGAVAKW